MLNKQAAAQASHFLTGYSAEKGIYMKINYFNADHTHALIDLPTNKCVEDVIQLFKGRSVLPIGLTNKNSYLAGSLGEKAMAHSQFRILM